MNNTECLLSLSLACAVPLWIMEFAKLDSEQLWDKFKARQEYLIDQIASHGDDILFKSKHKGDTAKAFNALAESLAYMAFVPGGVTAFGSHWEYPKPVLCKGVFGYMKGLIAVSNMDRRT